MNLSDILVFNSDKTREKEANELFGFFMKLRLTNLINVCQKDCSLEMCALLVLHINLFP